jgi:hypothetical protein
MKRKPAMTIRQRSRPTGVQMPTKARSCPLPAPGFWPLQAIDFIAYSDWDYCGVALGSTSINSCERGVRLRSPNVIAREAMGTTRQATHYGLGEARFGPVALLTLIVLSG